MTDLKQINDFLAERRLAIVGVSRNPKDFSRAVFREFLQRGYDAIPVNPLMTEAEGKPCVARLTEIRPPVQAVLFMTPPAVSEDLMRECADSGIKKVWFYRTPRKDEHAANALSFCKEHKVEIIAGYCPLMFLSDAPWFHRFHGSLLKLFGKYPR